MILFVVNGAGQNKNKTFKAFNQEPNSKIAKIYLQ